MSTHRPPCLVIIGGVNGSGKSTFASQLAGDDLLLGQTPLNPDALTREVLAVFPGLNEIGANLIAVERVEKAAWQGVALGESVALETVLSTGKYLSLSDAARARGLKTRLVFVGLPSVEDCIARVRVRVLAGEHDVPEDKIRSRWERAHDNLITFLDHVDDVLVFSNLPQNPTLVMERIGVGNPISLRDGKALPAVTRRIDRISRSQ